MTDYSYIGVGKLHLRVAGSASPLAFVGNCSALRFSVTEETKELKDYTQAGGGTYNEIRRIESVECQMTLHDLSADTLARAVFGTTQDITSGIRSKENVGAAYPGGLLVTEYPLDTQQAVTVEAVEGDGVSGWQQSQAYALDSYVQPTVSNGYFYRCTTAGTSGSGEPSWPTTVGATVSDGSTAIWTCAGKVALTADVDYVATAGGITLLDSAAVAPDESLQVSYTKAVGRSVEALLRASQEYELFFDGLNEARSGKPVRIHAFRVKLGATSGLDLIGDDYYAGEQAGKLLKDTTRNGVSESQYFRADIVS